MDLETFAECLRVAGVRLTAAELADALMVAAHGLVPVSDPVTKPETIKQPEPEATSTDGTVGEQPAPVRQLFDDGRGDVVPGTRGMRVHVPSGQALPHKLELARALRPFRARWRHGSRQSFDIEETIQSYADTRYLVPAVMPEPERWFEVNLIVDDTPAMKVWADTASELARLLEQTGAFRSVRTWQLHAEPDDVWLADTKGRRISPRMLLASGQRHLALVMSDWMDARWQATALWDALRRWGRAMPTALLNPLPARLWQRTRQTAEASVLGPGPPGTPNGGLSFETPRFPDAAAEWFALPTVSLDPHSIGRWASLLMRGDPSGCDGIVVPLAGPPLLAQPVAPAGQEQLVERFRVRSSAAAFRLATLCGIQPSVTLAVMHLIRQTMVPEANTGDIAEVVVSGLIAHRRTTGAGNLQFSFHDHARQDLLRYLTTDDAWQLFRGITGYIAERVGRDLTVTIAHPSGTLRLPEGLDPFAEATDATLRLLGIHNGRERQRIIMQAADEGRTRARDTIAAITPPALAPAPLRINAFGKASLFVNAERIPLSPPVMTVLIRLLLARGQTVSLDEILRDVWHEPHRPATRIDRTSVHRRILQLRAILDPSSLDMVAGRTGILGYRLEIDDEAVDIFRFPQLIEEAAAAPEMAVSLLQQALSLWGRPLVDVETLPFAAEPIAALHTYRARAQRDLIAAYRDAGRYDDALHLAHAVIAEDPQDIVAGRAVEELEALQAENRPAFAAYVRDIAAAARRGRVDILAISADPGGTELSDHLSHLTYELIPAQQNDVWLAYSGRPYRYLSVALLHSEGTTPADFLQRADLRGRLDELARPFPGPSLRAQEFTSAAHAIADVAYGALSETAGSALRLVQFDLVGGMQAGRHTPTRDTHPGGLPAPSLDLKPLFSPSSNPLRHAFVVAINISHYARLTDSQQWAQQQRFHRILHAALAEALANRSDVHKQFSGDGAIVVFSAGPDGSQALLRLLDCLAGKLAADNAREPTRMRLRVAADAGPVRLSANGLFGTAVINAARLGDSRELRTASADRDFSAMVSATAFDSTLDPRDFSPVDLESEKFSFHAWLWQPAGSEN